MPPTSTSTWSRRDATRSACRIRWRGCGCATVTAVDHGWPRSKLEDGTMTYKQTSEQLAQYRRQIGELRRKMRAAQAAVEPEEVKDYAFKRAGGGNGVYDHLRNRAAFVLSSPDAPERQRQFAAGRGWRFPMISYEGTSFG